MKTIYIHNNDLKIADQCLDLGEHHLSELYLYPHKDVVPELTCFVEKSVYDELKYSLEQAIRLLKEGKAKFAPNTTNSFVDDFLKLHDQC